MSLTKNFLLLTALLSFIVLAQGSCWRYGHSCWGGHGKRSGEPPGPRGKDVQQIIPILTNRNSRVTGDYYDQESLDMEESEGEDLSNSSGDVFVQDGGARNSLNFAASLLTPAAANELQHTNTFRQAAQTNQIPSTSDNVSNEAVEVDLGGGEVIDTDLLELESVGPREFLDRARKGHQKEKRPTVLIYRFHGRGQ